MFKTLGSIQSSEVLFAYFLDFFFFGSIQVTPAAGIIRPEQHAEVSVHHEESHTLEDFVDGVPQNWWSEDARDKELILVVIVHGSSSTEMKSHRIHLRHCFSSKAVRLESNSNSRKNQGGGAANRSELRQLSSSSDKGDDLQNSRKS